MSELEAATMPFATVPLPLDGLSGLWLGLRPYLPMLRLQQRLCELRKAGRVGDTVLFVEHPPTITLGRGSKAQHLLASQERLAALGVEVHVCGRGGDITLHAPGQLVCYPIVELGAGQRDVRRYVQTLVEVMRHVAQASTIAAGPVPGYVGLWVDRDQPQRWSGATDARSLAKLGAIGVAISRWVTSHGFALNLSTDLELFELIVPCGISEHPVTSIATLTGAAPTLREASELAHGALAGGLQRQRRGLIDASRIALEQIAPNSAPLAATPPH